MEYKGIDISKYQGDINFNEVKKNNIDFVIIRIGYGMYENQKDNKFEQNYNNAIKANLPVGVYLYSYATNENEAKKEAQVTLKWLNKRKLNLPVYYDVEDKSQNSISKEKLTSICMAYCQEIEKAGYWAGIYANKYWLTTHLHYKNLQNKYTIWVAQYNKTNTYKGKYDMWQYTSQGKVKGISTNVDMNILYKNIFTNLNNLSNTTSLVDTLKQMNIDSSFENRKKLYKQYGYKDTYKGTAKQNINLLNKIKQNKYYKTNYKGLSLVDGLKSINVDSSFENRKKIAQKNGMNNYKGTAKQNTNLLNLLKKGLLKIY